jgi:hypothetical protein
MATSATWNSTSMNDVTNYLLHEIDDADSPELDVSMFALARTHGIVVTDSRYKGKVITLTGKIMASSLVALENKIDTFHSLFAVTGKDLDLGYASGTRRYVCTPIKISVKRPVRAANWAEFEVGLMATEFGKDTSATTLINAVANTTSSYAPSLNVGGSAPRQPLYISITVTAATGLTGRTISVTTASGLVLSVRRDWTVSDILVIDESTSK